MEDITSNDCVNSDEYGIEPNKEDDVIIAAEERQEFLPLKRSKNRI